MKIYLFFLYLVASSIAFAGEPQQGSLIQIAGLLFSVLAFKLFFLKAKK